MLGILTEGKQTLSDITMVVRDEHSITLNQFVEVYHTLSDTYILCQVVNLFFAKPPRRDEAIYYASLKPVHPLKQPFSPDAEVREAPEDEVRNALGLQDCDSKLVLGTLVGYDIEVCIDPNVLTKHLAILGQTGSGKSYTAAVLLEELTKQGITTTIVDVGGDYTSLIDTYPGAARLTQLTYGAAWNIYSSGVVTILQCPNKSKWDSYLSEVLRDITPMILEGRAPPMALIIDEAQNFCPQKKSADSKKYIIQLASEGRKHGLALGIMSQRPAKVDKDVLSQCATKLMLKVSDRNDVKALIDSSGLLTTKDRFALQSLTVGEMLLEVRGRLLRVAVRKRESAEPEGRRLV